MTVVNLDIQGAPIFVASWEKLLVRLRYGPGAGLLKDWRCFMLAVLIAQVAFAAAAAAADGLFAAQRNRVSVVYQRSALI